MASGGAEATALAEKGKIMNLLAVSYKASKTARSEACFGELIPRDSRPRHDAVPAASKTQGIADHRDVAHGHRCSSEFRFYKDAPERDASVDTVSSVGEIVTEDHTAFIQFMQTLSCPHTCRLGIRSILSLQNAIEAACPPMVIGTIVFTDLSHIPCCKLDRNGADPTILFFSHRDCIAGKQAVTFKETSASGRARYTEDNFEACGCGIELHSSISLQPARPSPDDAQSSRRRKRLSL
jgi:hypothetical protein